jgi:hypothetical protein
MAAMPASAVQSSFIHGVRCIRSRPPSHERVHHTVCRPHALLARTLNSRMIDTTKCRSIHEMLGESAALDIQRQQVGSLQGSAGTTLAGR